MTPAADSPQTRLAASRKALVRQMARHDGVPDNDSNQGIRGAEQHPDAQGRPQGNGLWQIVKQGVLAWWRHHPAQIAVDIGRPFLNNYARDKPFQLLGIAAGVGASLVLVKPWRLVSVTGLAVAALKSTKLTTVLMSLIPGASTRRQYTPSQNS